jgi:hypothetical protein
MSSELVRDTKTEQPDVSAIPRDNISAAPTVTEQRTKPGESWQANETVSFRIFVQIVTNANIWLG